MALFLGAVERDGRKERRDHIASTTVSAHHSDPAASTHRLARVPSRDGAPMHGGDLAACVDDNELDYLLGPLAHGLAPTLVVPPARLYADAVASGVAVALATRA